MQAGDDVVQWYRRQLTAFGGLPSVGGTVGRAVRGDWQALLDQADQMLDRSKAEGRDRCTIAVAMPAGAGPGEPGRVVQRF